jgi:hypothetical protein
MAKTGTARSRRPVGNSGTLGGENAEGEVKVGIALVIETAPVFAKALPSNVAVAAPARVIDVVARMFPMNDIPAPRVIVAEPPPPFSTQKTPLSVAPLVSITFAPTPVVNVDAVAKNM